MENLPNWENTDEHQNEKRKTRKHIQNTLKNKVTYMNQTLRCSGINKTPTKKL